MTPPRLHLEDNGDETFTLLTDVVWFDLRTRMRIVARAGSRTDFASVPRIFWPVIPPYGRHGFAAVIHDELYRVQGRVGIPPLPRAECDRIFRDAMQSTGVRWTRRWVMWLAVRLFGWLPWHVGGDWPRSLHPIVAAFALVALLLFTGCESLDGYDRTYSLSYRDADGRELRTGVTLHPRGYAK